MLKISKESHLDHGLTLGHIQWILKTYGDKEGFFIETMEFPKELGLLDCGLHGPCMGDEPIKESEVIYEVRGKREGKSRLIDRPSRKSNEITIIAGPHGEDKCLLYTCFGGPQAPKETFDAPESEESRYFWANHALSKG